MYLQNQIHTAYHLQPRLNECYDEMNGITHEKSMSSHPFLLPTEGFRASRSIHRIGGSIISNINVLSIDPLMPFGTREWKRSQMNDSVQIDEARWLFLLLGNTIKTWNMVCGSYVSVLQSSCTLKLAQSFLQQVCAKL